MAKYVKMVLYAEPGVGKSTFASKAPKPFFVTTDGNYEWLGLPDEWHVQVRNGNQFEKIVDLLGTPDFDEFETVVIDLAEETYLLYEQTFCKKNKIESLADMDYGKGYDMVRKGYLILISKLISLPKNVIFLMHGEDDVSTKDIRGNVITKHVPSPKLPKKLLTSLEGKVQYFLRAYVKAEVSNDPNSNKVFKKRYLSLVPKANDFGISRGADENEFPEDIELDWDVFAEIIGLNKNTTKVPSQKTALQALIDDISDTPTRPTAATRPNIAPVAPKPTPAPTVARPTVATPKPTPTVAKEEVKEEPVKEEEITLNKANETEEVKAPTPSKEDLIAKLKAKNNAQKKEEAPQEEVVEEKVVETAKPVETTKPVVNAKDVTAKLEALKALKNKK